ncbi:DUF3870 domain-containing protein [Pseudogracilibacillus sp. SO30301A]|uniref:DUF3870 domain-containing protein n=1 Tax=Pseudogracilibacillus sp. SO30301A TaxID=3098291 RepID=UPI00300E3F5D
MKTVLITAYSKAPQGTPMYEKFKYSGIVLEIDKTSHLVVDIEVTFITKLAQDFFKRLMVGADFSSDLDSTIEKIKKNYYAPSQQSIIVALKVAHQRYWDEIKKNT